MKDLKTQQERRRWLIHALLEEMPQYQYPVFPYTQERQERLLRSLMNVRPPMPVSEEFLKVQGRLQVKAFLSHCPAPFYSSSLRTDKTVPLLPGL